MAGMPVYELLGGKTRFAVDCYGHASGNTPEEVVDRVQFFKEERVDGAVYNVYLKKVRYYTPDVGARALTPTRRTPSPSPRHSRSSSPQAHCDDAQSLFHVNLVASTQRCTIAVLFPLFSLVLFILQVFRCACCSCRLLFMLFNSYVLSSEYFRVHS